MWTARGSSTSDRTRSANTTRRSARWSARLPRAPETQGGGGAGGRARRGRARAGPRRPWPGRRIPRRGGGGRGADPAAAQAAAAAHAAFRAKYPADDADDRRTDRRDPDRRGRQRDLRRRQLPRRTRDGLRPQHARVQARLGRLRQAAVADQHQRRRPRVHAGRTDAEGVRAATSRSTSRTTASSTPPTATPTASTSPTSRASSSRSSSSRRRPASAASTGGVAFSPDKQQRFLFISDLTNNHIWFLNREDGKVVGQMGSMGENGGQLFGLHMIAVDSQGQHLHGRGVQRRARAAVRAGRQPAREAARSAHPLTN